MLLSIQSFAKPWGVEDLPAPFHSDGKEPIGEIRFDPPPAIPDILVKYIFTSEKLSVQVHPSDADTDAAGLGRRGKDECWLITSAEPRASLAIGFREPLDPARVRSAAINGTIEDLLAWHSASVGDFFYIPAGTVHAIGAGIALLEVQQASDITYRFYDYGRPRQLHLSEALDVACLEPYDPKNCSKLPNSSSAFLIDGPHFQVIFIDGSSPAEALGHLEPPLLVIPLKGRVRVDGESARPGNCALFEGKELHFDEAAQFLIARPLVK